RVVVTAGAVLTAFGTYLMTNLGVHSSQLDVSIDMAFLGAGMGFVFMSTALAAQNSVDLPRMGVATGLVNFTRQLGGALGVAIAGAVMLNSLTSRIAELFPGQHVPAGALLSAQTARSFPVAAQDAVRGAFADSLNLVFVTMLVIAILGMFSTLLMPRGKPEREIDPEEEGYTVVEWTLTECVTYVIIQPMRIS